MFCLCWDSWGSQEHELVIQQQLGEAKPRNFVSPLRARLSLGWEENGSRRAHEWCGVLCCLGCRGVGEQKRIRKM